MRSAFDEWIMAFAQAVLFFVSVGVLAMIIAVIKLILTGSGISNVAYSNLCILGLFVAFVIVLKKISFRL